MHSPSKAKCRRLWPALLLSSLVSLCWHSQALAETEEGSATAAPAREEPAQAQPHHEGAAAALSAAQLQEDMHHFYNGERLGGIWLMGLGAPALATGAGLMFHPGEFQRGLGYPLLVFGALEVVAGTVFYLSSKRRVPRFDDQLRSHPADFHAQELRHLRGINRDMRLIEVVEIALMMAGGAMSGIGTLRGEGTLAGVGTGLLAEGAVLFLYDQLLARRARVYYDSLTRFGVGVVGEPGAGSGKTASFAPRGAVFSMARQF